MNTTLSCGCKESPTNRGIFAEWDGFSREYDPAKHYGVICIKHFREYGAKKIETVEYDECSDEDGDVMCKNCNCWKKTREMCS